MIISFTDHALKQLSERELSKKTVVEAVEKPDFTKKQTDGRIRIIKVPRRKQRGITARSPLLFAASREVLNLY